MKRIIKSFLKSVNSNETFVTLLRVAQEDPEVKKWLIGILSWDKFNRKSAIHTLIEQLILEKAPADFIAAIEVLLDDEVAAKGLDLLTGK
jgi:hypothetical protein